MTLEEIAVKAMPVLKYNHPDYDEKIIASMAFRQAREIKEALRSSVNQEEGE